MKKIITIITPTYNRRKELEKLYASLCEQTCDNFRWLIIDDGSEDNTESYVKKIKKVSLDITYLKKKNGGKHTALNFAFQNLETELAMIVDSDDYLTGDAIERIMKDWEKYRNNKKICGLCYLKKYTNGESVCQKFDKMEFISNYNDYVINGSIKGDKLEIFKSSILKNYRYPEYRNEKFIGEGVLWSQIAHYYDMVFINYPIYICEYLDGGLTKSGRKLRINNPLGGMYHAKEYLDKRYTMKIREKNALLFLTYSFFSKNNLFITLKSDNHFILLSLNILPSFILYLYWKLRYVR